MAKLWSISGLADEFGMDRRTVKKRLENIPPCGQVRCNNAWKLKVAVHHVFTIGSFADAGSEDQEERNKFYDAELKLEKLKKGKELVIPVELFQRELGAVIRSVTQSFDMYPDVLERDGVLTADQVDVFRSHLDNLRNDLHLRLKDIDVLST